ncbi:udp-glc gal endoplasmic reticulum nucleotide sugar transporter protein [Diplodia corticola]|uniref:Udp-glc gal endoplasmic reticulum nucleotide sugar transporter protein n=1 Tax=Diplodia corticola TaxID=236234 RepID=A0A1J9RLP1_9PEZI|nr:udp-glc gal endoplasmic reticulum nucleotide sugar transporter protein [Diplodia corticola]OJD28844.1 udp-glc gal endoplasmic reticulum nucleotide sugar transporter protein [Diplodia corticola]
MKRPDIELLRAKLALMSPDDCPPDVVAAARKRFPDALSMVWAAPPPVAPEAGSKGSKSSSKMPAIVGSHYRTRSDTITSHPNLSLNVEPMVHMSSSWEGYIAEFNRRARANAVDSMKARGLDADAIEIALSDHGLADLLWPALPAKNNSNTTFDNARLNQHAFAQNGMVQGNIGQNNTALGAMAFAEDKKIATPSGGMTDDGFSNYLGPQHRNNLPQGGAGPFIVTDADVAGAISAYRLQAKMVVSQTTEVPAYVRDANKEATTLEHLSSEGIQPYAPARYHSDAGSGDVGPTKNGDERICKDTVDESGGVIPMAFVPKTSADSYNSSAERAAIKRKHDCVIEKNDESGLGNAEHGKIAQEVDVIIISDEDSDFDVKGVGTNDDTNDEMPRFEPRYVVIGAVGWTFREVKSLKEAVGACLQVMPPIDAGNGVQLFVNDTAHVLMLRGLETEARDLAARRELTGSSSSRPSMRTECKRTKMWLLGERGYRIDPNDKKWDFSPLWYLFKTKMAEIKKDEEDMGRASGDGGARAEVGDGSGGANGNVAGNGDGPAVGVAGSSTNKQKRRCSEADMAWLRSDDDE